MYLPKQMVVRYAMDSPTALMTLESFLQQQTSMGTPEKIDQSAHSDASFAESNISTINGEGKVVINDTVGAVRLKPITARGRRYNNKYASAITKRLSPSYYGKKKSRYW